MALKGFIELLRLDSLAKSRPVHSIEDSVEASDWQGIAFEVAGERFVAPIGEIAEVLAVPATFTQVPLAKPWLMGIANVRGQLLPLADLAKFLNLNSRAEQLMRRKVLVIHQQDMWFGILVDAVWSIKKFSRAQYVAKNLANNSPFLPYNHGQFIQEEQHWPVFMPSLLTQDPRFLDASV